MSSIEVRKWAAETPPRAYGSAGPVGQTIVLQTTTTASYVSLAAATFGLTYSAEYVQQVSGTNAPTGQPVGLVGCFVTVYADTANVGIIFGQTAASVSGFNAPNLASFGTVANGVYTGVAGTCAVIPAGMSKRYLTQIGQDLFLGFVGASAGLIRINQSSAYGLDG